MSSSAVISDVTQTLEELLKSGQLPQGSFDVSINSPADEKVQPSMKPKVNLFLFRVSENPFAKNQGWVPAGTDTLKYPPLALNLSYVLTPYADNKLDEQRVNVEGGEAEQPREISEREMHARLRSLLYERRNLPPRLLDGLL